MGYEAIGELLDVLRRELRKNMYHPLKWIEGDAFSLLWKFNIFGILGIDMRSTYMLGTDAIASIYEALTYSDQGGPIALSILKYENQAELEEWCINSIPEALGPLLLTLASPHSKFDENSPDGTPYLTLQQQAIEKILSWIRYSSEQAGNIAAAQRQFEEACTRMNKFGKKPPNPGQAYCENRMKLDSFMSTTSSKSTIAIKKTLARYNEHTAVLGKLKDQYCQKTGSYTSGFIRIPGHSLYTGPDEQQ